MTAPPGPSAMDADAASRRADKIIDDAYAAWNVVMRLYDDRIAVRIEEHVASKNEVAFSLK